MDDDCGNKQYGQESVQLHPVFLQFFLKRYVAPRRTDRTKQTVPILAVNRTVPKYACDGFVPMGFPARKLWIRPRTMRHIPSEMCMLRNTQFILRFFFARYFNAVARAQMTASHAVIRLSRIIISP